MSESMVERVARAIAWEHTELRYKLEWGPKEKFPVQDEYRKLARVALRELLNPTDAMIEAGVSRHSATIADEWRAMVAAALKE